jgi:hypothetical protein
VLASEARSNTRAEYIKAPLEHVRLAIVKAIVSMFPLQFSRVLAMAYIDDNTKDKFTIPILDCRLSAERSEGLFSYNSRQLHTSI